MNNQTSHVLDSFIKGERTLSLPFDLDLNGEIFRCEKVLRLLPAQRLVVLAKDSEGLFVVIKLFAKKQKGQREFERELEGYKLTQDAGVTAPAVHSVDNEHEDWCAIAYDYIEGSQTFNLDEDYENRAFMIMQFMATMHAKGIYQDDIHLDNILMQDAQLFLIDLSSVKTEARNSELSKKTSLLNLARLFAQFHVTDRNKLLPFISIYFQQRKWHISPTDDDAFRSLVNKVWQKRKRDYLRKCMRTCTMTVYHKDFYWEYAFKRDFFEESLPITLSEMESLFKTARVLKDGNTATVIHTHLNGRAVVIKRYNIKSFWHGLSRCWRPSRALNSWLNANLLEFIGIPTVRPIGFIEKRWGWLRKTAYFISEYREAEELINVYQHRLPSENELNQVEQIFAVLKRCCIGHGDMKAQNLLLSGQHVLLIDLDAMKTLASEKGSQKAFKKDRERFLKNWQDESLKSLFASRIN